MSSRLLISWNRLIASLLSSPAAEHLVRDLRYARRSFVRAPLPSLTVILTVGMGLGLVAAVYTLLNTMVFRVDEVYNPHELFGVARQNSAISEPASFTRAEYDALLRETDIYREAFASSGDRSAWIDGVRREGRLVTGNFFQVLGVSAAQGRTFANPDDDAARPPVLVLSHRAWEQHYAGDPGVVGRSFRVNGTAFRVIGVMPEGFRGLEPFAAPDFWAPLAHDDLFRETGSLEASATVGNLNIVGRLRTDLSREQAVARLNAWNLRNVSARSATNPANLQLEPRLGTVPRPAEAMLVFMPLFFAFGLILLIGCANVANLLLARLLKRQREIGVRLAIGASRSRVVWQLLTENLLLSLGAAILAFAVSRFVLRIMVYALTSSFPPEIGNLRIAVPAADWRVALFLFAGAMASTALFALAPALRATRLDVTRVMHGDLLGASRPGRGRNALVALQVTGSALLLISAAIFLRGAWSAAAIDPGFRTADVINVSILNESRRNTVLDSLQSEPAVASLAASWPGFLGGAPAYGEGASGRSVVTYQFVSPEFFGVLGIDLVRGRGFNGNERSPDEPVAVISASTARLLWPDGDPLGQVLRLDPDPTLRPGPAPEPARSADPRLRPRTAVVVGIARDVPGFQIVGTRLTGASIYLPTDAAAPGTALIARVNGNLEQARRALVDRLAAIDPNLAEVATLQMLADADAYLLGTSFWLTLALGLLALLMTVSGLFSVLSYLVEQRTREIGVRMALGASSRKIGGLVLLQSARPVGLGLLLGAGLTVGVGAALLATPAAEAIAATVPLFDPAAYLASIACIVVACTGAALFPALRAGRVNPLAALRED